MEDEAIDTTEKMDDAKIRENIEHALLRFDKAQLIFNDIEAAYLKIQDLDPEVYPEVKAEYQRIEALLNMLFDFLSAGKSELDKIIETVAEDKKE
ncbi:MAG TPA: hypothetical protein P5309_06840 [Syntrophomonadaceae bacterium]|nr:hypothetical protein [Syntrophomonadaceae bacterium]